MTRRVIVTRPQYKGSSDDTSSYANRQDQFIGSIESLGYSVLNLSVLEIRVRHSEENLEYLTKLNDGYFDWVVLMSPTATYVLKELLGAELSIPPNTKIASQGVGTGGLIENVLHRRVDYIPETQIAEFLAEGLVKQLKPQSKVFIPRSADSRRVVERLLNESGALCTPLVTYATQPCIPKLIGQGAEIEINSLTADEVLIFMSPSAARATAEVARGSVPQLLNAKVVSVGPITSRACHEEGFLNVIEAKSHSEEGILEELSLI